MTVTATPTQSPTAHLTADDIEAIGAELDAIRERIIESRGARDAAYIRRVILAQRAAGAGWPGHPAASPRGRSAWWIGTASLSLAKILENMEIGHNVLHGQWDWMRDPKIQSSTWDWDHSSPPEQWKRAHNETHHKYTNIVGKDNDLGYGIMRVAEEQEWQPRHLAQPFVELRHRLHLRVGHRDVRRRPRRRDPRQAGDAAGDEGPAAQGAAQGAASRSPRTTSCTRPCPGRGFRRTLAANAIANLTRNVWSHSVIMCGHFPEGVETFELESLNENETKGEWYVRQMLGSADISGSPFMHLMTGNLSHQIEHHCFPDLPSNRYGEIAPEIEDLFQRYGLELQLPPAGPAGRLARGTASCGCRSPTAGSRRPTGSNLGSQLKKLGRMARKGSPASQ